GVPSAAHPAPLLAPQATLVASVAKGMFGGELPWGMVKAGAGIAVAIIILDEVLRRRGSSFRVPVLAGAIGIYLPIDVTAPIFLGGIITWLVERAQRARAGHQLSAEESERTGRKGVLFAAGMITGESLMGVIIAIPIVLSGRADVLSLPPAWHFGQWLGVLLVIGMAVWLYRTALARD
ncbi:MAG TPA: OPT/YSL family transporter, partial [Steroidobacteraceae bacterium]|nr:OPT/YSL family transporter [Steroidobacteraceae bacterium]